MSDNLAREVIGQPGVVKRGNLMENRGLIHAALGHLEMQVWVDIDLGS